MWKKLIFILIAVFALAGCNEAIATIAVDDFVNHENHESVVFIDDGRLLEPNGIAFDGEYIYIADAEHNTVFIYDIQGNYVGRLGNDSLEFKHPVAVAVSPVDNSIFVAEESGRIQIIQEGINVRDIFMDDIGHFWGVLDIEVDGDNYLYVSVMSVEETSMKIHVFNSQGERTEIGRRHIGFLGRGENNEILFAQKFEVIDEKTVGSGFANFFGQIVDHELAKIAQLPGHYTPSAIFSRNNRIYLFSYGFGQLDAFNLDGSYIETVYRYEVGPENPQRGMSYVIAFGSDSFLITDSERGMVLKIRPVEH